jgi:DNA-binding IclR family transcriptional regulator
VEKAFTILEVLAESRAGMSLPDLVQQTGIPKSSVHCLLITLERRGYIHRNRTTGRYMFATRLFSLANMSLIGLNLREQATPHLRTLATKTGLTTHMAILEHGEAVLISKFEPMGIFRLATWIGKRMDVHCTSLGKALIADLPKDEILEVLKAHGMPRHNENTIASTQKLLGELALTAERGYSIDDEEDEIGLRCIGVPIRDHTGAVIAAISVSGTSQQVTRENLLPLSRMLKDTAARISEAMGQQAIDNPGDNGSAFPDHRLHRGPLQPARRGT